MLNGLEAIFRYTVILGLTPYNKTKNIQHQRVEQIYIALLLSLEVGISSYCIITLQFNNNPKLSNAVLLLMLLATVAAVIVILLESTCTYLEHQRYYTQCRKIEQLFRRQLQCTFDERKQRHYLIWKYLIICAVVFGCYILKAILFGIFKYGTYIWQLSIILILRSRTLQFLAYADVIGFYVEALNAKLLPVVCCKFQFKLAHTDIEVKRLKSLEYLLLLKGLHMEIGTLTQCWNFCFGWSALVVWSSLFVEILMTLYSIFLVLAEIYPFEQIYVAINSFIPLIVLNFIICYTCHQCECENRRTLALVQKLLQPTNGDLNIRIYNDLVNEFSTQIKNDPIEFGAYGIFRINLKLFMATFTALVTHLVILIQFRTTDVDSGDQGGRNNSTKC